MSVKMFKHKSYETGQFPEVNYCNLMPLLHELSDQNQTLRTDKKSNVKAVLVWPICNCIGEFSSSSLHLGKMNINIPTNQGVVGYYLILIGLSGMNNGSLY